MAVSRIAVIGDVHSNYLALCATLQSISCFEAEFASIDTFVFMGDLMTYGVLPNETLSTVLELSSCRDVQLILGNHDQLYLDLVNNVSTDYYHQLPGWIRESVDMHLNILDVNLLSSLDFVRHYQFSSTLFCHANFNSVISGTNDWSYVNSLDDHREQLHVLYELGYRLGVLGHTHRGRLFSLFDSPPGRSTRCASLPFVLNTPVSIDKYPFSIVNSGSIGQPRDAVSSSPCWLALEIDDAYPLSVTFVPFDYDTDSHLNDLTRSGLSPHCVQKLLSYF